MGLHGLAREARRRDGAACAGQGHPGSEDERDHDACRARVLLRRTSSVRLGIRQYCIRRRGLAPKSPEGAR